MGRKELLVCQKDYLVIPLGSYSGLVGASNGSASTAIRSVRVSIRLVIASSGSVGASSRSSDTSKPLVVPVEACCE